MRYGINLVRELRQKERRQHDRRRAVLVTALVSFAVLVAALTYGAANIGAMRRVIRDEREQLARIETEYHKYKETKMIVDKADLELLDRLQSNRVFWTSKLASMALHLPEDYWITGFDYRQHRFTVEGYGYISPEQRQLITLDAYLYLLRTDSSYNDVFDATALLGTERDDEHRRRRVNFEYVSIAPKGRSAR